MDRDLKLLVKKRAIALIVKEPTEIYLDFLATFVSYDVYIIIDSDKSMLHFQKKYKMLNIIQFDEKLCLKYGYKNVNYIGIRKRVSGWDKALLFFSVIIPNMYNQVWFIEDDVFFLEEKVLINLDEKYEDQDLLANCDFKSQRTNNIKEELWVWPLIDIKIANPHYCGMMCITRISKHLLQGIRWYATRYKTLFFLEALFPTMTSHLGLTYFNPDELTSVTYNQEFNEETDVSKIKTYVFHPIKDINNHKELRNKYNK
jgi:hypothetical protein